MKYKCGVLAYREHMDCEGCEESLENKLFVSILFIQSFEELCYFKINEMERCSREIKHTSSHRVSAHFEVAEAVQMWWWCSGLVNIQEGWGDELAGTRASP